jgi:hypothetical protein
VDAEGLQCFKGIGSFDGSVLPIRGDDCLTDVPLLHPADRQPPDSRLTISELTAYGSAWRRGEVWPLPPNPIPIDYVTRAAALWQGGEFYVLDLEIGMPPLCWVNHPTLPLEGLTLDRHSVDDTRTIQRLPTCYLPGEPLVLTVEVSPASGAAGYALEIICPQNGEVSEINDGGVWNAAEGKVRWGPFLDDAPRELEFRMIPTSFSDALLRFSGVVSVDGQSEPIEGDLVVRPGTRLTGVSGTLADGVVISLRGCPGQLYTVEATSDLETWHVLGETREHGGQVVIADPRAGDLQLRFYRLRPAPE